MGSTSVSPDLGSHLGLKKVQYITEGRTKKLRREPEVVATRPEPGVPEIPLPTEALAARGDSLKHLRRRTAGSLSRSACPASASTVVGVAGEQDDPKRRMDEYMLHEEYHKSIRGEDGEESMEALGSPPQTDMDSYYYSGPPTDLAATASLPRRPRGTPWPTFSTAPCKGLRGGQNYPQPRESQKHIQPTWRVLISQRQPMVLLIVRRTARQTVIWIRRPDMTALSEAVRAKLGISEPLTMPAMASPSPGLTSLADHLKRSSVSRLLPKVTCPGPFHPRATTVAMAELQDVPVTEAKKNELTALATLAGRLRRPSDPTSGGGKSGNPIAQANIQLELPVFDPKTFVRMGRRICRISSAYRPLSCGCGHQMFASEAFIQNKMFAETG